MKMKRLKALLKVALLSCTFLLFVNCDTDDVPQDSQAHQHEDSNKISFNDFIKKTKIKKFDVNIKPVAAESDVLGRSSEDLQFIGFTVDTLTVKQLVKNGETTFTLPVIPNPYPNNPNFYYNIVFHQVGGAYQWSILEFEKTEENVEVTELLNESTNNGMVEVSGRIYTNWTTGPIYHCTRTGPCADGPCDRCSQCISIGTIMGSIEIPDREFMYITDTPDALLNAGGSTPNSSVPNSLNVAINAFKTTLTPAQLAIYTSNKLDFDNYLRNNSSTLVGSLGQQSTLIYPSAQQFVMELIIDLMNFPAPEGNDGGDEFDYDDYSDIITQTQSLPSRNSFYSNFPKDGSSGMSAGEVYQLLGGSILNSHITNPDNYGNACALRVSRALNYSGNPIPVFYNKSGQQRTEKGADNKNYILDAASLLAYMKKTFPSSNPLHLVNKTPTEIKKALQNKWGIYIMIPKNRATFGASGHADFWSQNNCLSGSYIDKASEVYFWELN